MTPDSASFWTEAMTIWSSGGWLMAPLLALTVFIYYSGLELLLHLETHFLIRSRVHEMSDNQIAAKTRNGLKRLRPLLHESAVNVDEVKRHFGEVRAEYLPQINRRIRFLGVVIPIGPLVGLLGTVTGMLSTFAGMAGGQGSRFDNVIQGISEALITTQTGLVISIPALAHLPRSQGRLPDPRRLQARRVPRVIATAIATRFPGICMKERRLIFAEESRSNDINVSPLIDIVFILLIFFIVTTVFVEETGVEVQRPQSASAQDLEKNAILIAVTAEGNVVYGGADIGVRGVRGVVKRLLKQKDQPVIVQADKRASVELYTRVHDEAALAGATRINLATQN